MSNSELLVLHSGCFEETESIQNALEVLEQNGSVIHIFLKELEDDETWDHALWTILEVPRMICV